MTARMRRTRPKGRLRVVCARPLPHRDDEVIRVVEPTPQAFRRERYSTTDVPAARRTGYWSEVVREAHCPMDLRYAGHDDYRGALCLQRTPTAQIVRWCSREPLDITRRTGGADGEVHQILMPLQGRLRKEQDGREAVCEPGQLTVIDQSRPYRFSQPGPLTAVMLSMPSADLVAASGRTPRTAVVIDVRAGLGRVFRGMLREVAQTDGLDRVGFDIAYAHLRGLLAAVVSGTANTDDTATRRAAHREAILRHVRAHLADPRLGTGHVAASLHLSPRYVQVLLHDSGTTVRDLVRTERLTAARSLLERSSRPIGDIALCCGFSAASSFSTQFRAEFGMSPREARARTGRETA